MAVPEGQDSPAILFRAPAPLLEVAHGTIATAVGQTADIPTPALAKVRVAHDDIVGVDVRPVRPALRGGVDGVEAQVEKAVTDATGAVARVVAPEGAPTVVVGDAVVVPEMTRVGLATDVPTGVGLAPGRGNEVGVATGVQAGLAAPGVAIGVVGLRNVAVPPAPVRPFPRTETVADGVGAAVAARANVGTPTGPGPGTDAVVLRRLVDAGQVDVGPVAGADVARPTVGTETLPDAVLRGDTLARGGGAAIAAHDTARVVPVLTRPDPPTHAVAPLHTAVDLDRLLVGATDSVALHLS